MAYHVPVMVEEVVAGLVTDPSGVYVDATAGGGGHAEALLRALGERGHLLACDRDAAAVNEAGRRLDPYRGRVTLLQCAFASLPRSAAPFLDRLERSGVEGVLFDLGVSSHQIDEPGRGFSYHQDGPLDMRMDRGAGEPAGQLLARVREADLAELIRRNGEERQAGRIARAICRFRDEGRMETTAHLAKAIETTRPQRPTKTLARGLPGAADRRQRRIDRAREGDRSGHRPAHAGRPAGRHRLPLAGGPDRQAPDGPSW